ncbi:MAG TPA: hypothetical protein VL220_08565 [Steroidobacteraceae bacterium]|jgi:hypothetical protein|nr:hypothetical protein [Steroidobacteraceae bacterium]
MLRTALLVFAGALVLTGGVLLLHDAPRPGAYALGLGLLIVIGTVFERWRYRPHDGRPGAGWEPTGERFEDPQSGETLRVFYDPRSGERRYVSDSESSPNAESRRKP